ncbi:MAG: hypothetical protein Q9Q13_06850, partial [Acidobacteriota bacterium]|nr:hypothetical protein [Acidobacteriota bacterium]
ESDVRLERCLLLEGARCEPGVRLENVVLDAGVCVPAGRHFADGVVTTGEGGGAECVPFAAVGGR